jgi:hypothetical protein
MYLLGRWLDPTLTLDENSCGSLVSQHDALHVRVVAYSLANHAI